MGGISIGQLSAELRMYSLLFMAARWALKSIFARSASEKKGTAFYEAGSWYHRINLPKVAEAVPYHTRNIDTQKTLTIEQIHHLLEASKDTPIHMQVLFNVLMGLRRQEINGLKYSDVDYINRTLSVERQLGKELNRTPNAVDEKPMTKRELPLKTSSSRRVLLIPDYVFEAILEERKIYERNRSRRKSQFLDLDYICCSSYGKPRSKDFHWRHYKKLLKKASLPDIRWHDLRITYCTLLLKNDFNAKAISKLMGHATYRNGRISALKRGCYPVQ